MDENKTQNQAETTETAKPAEAENDIQNIVASKLAELKAANQLANEVMAEGKGRLRLETPIQSGDEEITELVYDFTALTGLEYADAMDSDANATQVFRITYRQGLALFAKAAAKQTNRLDMQDIISKIGMTDAQEGVQLAALFFNASARAARRRISKIS